MNFWGKLLGCASVLALATGIGTADAQTKTGVVKIGSNMELSGNFVAVGIPPATAIRMAVKEINDKGGFVVGDTTYKLQLVEVDNKGATASAVSEMIKLVEDEKVKFVFGPTLGALAAQAGEISIPAKVIHITQSSVWQVRGYHSDPTRPLLFNTQLPLGNVAAMDAAALKELGAKKIVFMGLDDETTKSNLDAFLKTLIPLGFEVVPILFPSGTTDFSSYVTRAKSSGDAIYFLYPQAQAPDLLRTVVDLNAGGKGFGARAVDPNVALKGVNGKPLPFPFFTTYNTPSFDYPATDKVKAYRERLLAFSPGLAGPSVSFSFFTYDFVYMLTEAMKKAGSVDDTAKIAAAMTALTYDGVAGKICFPGGVRNAVMEGGQIWVREGKLDPKLIPSGC